MTEQVKYKMQKFLGKLWMNPTLQKTPLSKKGNQIRLYREKRKANQEKPSIKMDDIF